MGILQWLRNAANEMTLPKRIGDAEKELSTARMGRNPVCGSRIVGGNKGRVVRACDQKLMELTR